MRVRLDRLVAALAVFAANTFRAPGVRADERRPESAEPYVTTPLAVGRSYHLFTGAGFGGTLRFNNPYRLRHELGDSAESISAPAPYFNLRLGATVRGAKRLSHGAEVDASLALGGVPQEVVTPSYLLVFHALPRWAVRGRAGIPIVLEPDANAGFELALGGVFFATAALGVTLDLVGSMFYGAATVDTSRSAIPLASLELGLLYDYEILP